LNKKILELNYEITQLRLEIESKKSIIKQKEDEIGGMHERVRQAEIRS
jgi:hypothetical protein